MANPILLVESNEKISKWNKYFFTTKALHLKVYYFIMREMTKRWQMFKQEAFFKVGLSSFEKIIICVNEIPLKVMKKLFISS